MRAKLNVFCRSSSPLDLTEDHVELVLMSLEKGRRILAENFWAAESFLWPLTSIGRREPLQALRSPCQRPRARSPVRPSSDEPPVE
jgi:hypothetical protein